MFTGSVYVTEIADDSALYFLLFCATKTPFDVNGNPLRKGDILLRCLVL